MNLRVLRVSALLAILLTASLAQATSFDLDGAIRGSEDGDSYVCVRHENPPQVHVLERCGTSVSVSVGPDGVTVSVCTERTCVKFQKDLEYRDPIDAILP